MSTVKKKMFLVNSKLDIALATKESFSSLKLPRSFGVEVKHKKRRKKTNKNKRKNKHKAYTHPCPNLQPTDQPIVIKDILLSLGSNKACAADDPTTNPLPYYWNA